MKVTARDWTWKQCVLYMVCYYTGLFGLPTLVLALLLCGTASATTAPNCDANMDDDRIALACNIYWEARTESYEGMLAVVAVTLNRVAHSSYPNTVREVVWQRRQFSWTHDGLYDTPRHRTSWREALQMASRFTITKQRRQEMCPTANQIMAAILGRPDPGCESYRNLVNIHMLLAEREDPTGGALFYHAHYVKPRWVDERHLTKVIGAHVFYARALVRN